MYIFVAAAYIYTNKTGLSAWISDNTQAPDPAVLCPSDVQEGNIAAWKQNLHENAASSPHHLRRPPLASQGEPGIAIRLVSGVQFG